MSKLGVKVILRRRNGYGETIELDPEELGDFTLDGDVIPEGVRSALLEQAIKRRVNAKGLAEEFHDIEAYLVDYKWIALEVEGTDMLDPTAVRQVSRCRSVLQLANMVLPPSVREDALDEWMDEILSAADAGLPFRRRVLSILCRSLPALALRARLPVRARRGEG